MFDPQREERQRSEKPKRKEKKKWVKQRGRVIDDRVEEIPEDDDGEAVTMIENETKRRRTVGKCETTDGIFRILFKERREKVQQTKCSNVNQIADATD